VSTVIHEFTAKPPRWRPYITPVDLKQASAEQLDALKVTPSNTKVSDYVLVLAHDPESLSHRTPLFNAIMYGEQGLPRAERELGAVGSSVVNRCVYCAAVHANRFISLAKQPEVIEQIFKDGENVKLEPRQQAIFDFATRLSHTPPRADADDIAALKQVGMSELEIVDLTLSIAIFGWANRLMHTLGEPVA
jgi:uncharacterized peroxidase-related enzyme